VSEPASQPGSGQLPEGQLPPLRGGELLLATIAISLATFMEVLDTTIVNVSVPSIAGTLGVSPNEGTWAITSYSMAAAIMQPLTGWLARRFGEVRVFTLSTLLFVCCSALCGFATSMPMLVAGRLMQGAVSGPMVPMAQTLLMRSYPPEKRGMAMGIWGMVVFVAPIFGPILGGWITDNLSWSWLFYINVPVGLFGGLVSWLLLRRRETKREKTPVDVTGMVLLFIGVAALQFMLDNGNEMDWFGSHLILGCAIVSAIALSLLVAWELTDRHPVLDLHLFAYRNFRIGLVTMCLGFACFFGGTVMFPLFLQTTAGYTATWAGLAMSGVGIIGIFMMPVVGANMARMNLRLAGTFGFVVIALSMYWTSRLNETATFMQMAAPRVLLGAGLAFFFMPLNTILFSDVQTRDLAAASGLSSFMRTIAGSLSTAITIWLWSDRSSFHGSVLAGNVRPGANWDAWSGQLGTLGVGTEGALAQSQYVVANQAQVLGANDIFLVFTVLTVACLPLLWLARPPFRVQGAGGGH
jgi:DHA2 family multidrug resistance protein